MWQVSRTKAITQQAPGANIGKQQVPRKKSVSHGEKSMYKFQEEINQHAINFTSKNQHGKSSTNNNQYGTSSMNKISFARRKLNVQTPRRE